MFKLKVAKKGPKQRFLKNQSQTRAITYSKALTPVGTV